MRKIFVVIVLLCGLVALGATWAGDAWASDNYQIKTETQRIQVLETMVAKLEQRVVALEMAQLPASTPTPNTRSSKTPSDDGDAVAFSDFEFKFLAIRSNIYDEYSYKVTMTNNTDRSLSLLVRLTFYDASKFDIGTGDTQIIALKPNEQKTLTGKASIRYPEADDVDSAGISAECAGAC